MDCLKFSNRCVFRDNVTGHIYRLNKTSANTEYYSCWIKNCSAKVKICGNQKNIYSEHTHSDKLAKYEYKKILFDKHLNEILPSVNILEKTSDTIYNMVVSKMPNAQFSADHKKKKLKLINTNRCFAKKYKASAPIPSPNANLPSANCLISFDSPKNSKYLGS